MNIKPIKDQKSCREALAEVDKLFDAKPNTPEGDKLDILVTLIEAYEEKHHAIDLPDPIESIKYMLEDQGVTRKELEECIGSRARVSEVLNRKRKLTLPMIRKLYDKFKIPARILIKA